MIRAPCAGCGKRVPSYDLVRYGSESVGFQDLCSDCFNATVAAAMGMDRYESPQFAPVSIADHKGVTHTFHFQYRNFGTAVSLEGFELNDEGPTGHQFKIYGEPDDDPFSLLTTLIKKIRTSLSQCHLVDGLHGPRIADHGVVRGQIDIDPDSHDYTPLLVIDGQEITWDEFGSMLRGYEGWRFKLMLHECDEDA